MAKMWISSLTLGLSWIMLIKSASIQGTIFEQQICEGREQGEQIAHPADCAKYFICDHNGPRLVTCHSNLHYDSEKGVCNWPTLANCRLGELSSTMEVSINKEVSIEYHPPSPAISVVRNTIKPKIKTTKSPLKSTTIRKHETQKILTTLKNPITIIKSTEKCSAEGSRFIAHSSDCTKHYVCLRGKAILTKCPNGLWWDELNNWCDYPEQSYCTAANKNHLNFNTAKNSDNLYESFVLQHEHFKV